MKSAIQHSNELAEKIKKEIDLGSPTPAGQSHVFMVTNLCRNVYPNQNWCNQGTGPYGNGHNDYGYVAHFDLGNGANQISRIGWNNPEVTWEIVSCHGANTPTDEMYQHCQCAHHGKRSLNESTNGSENGF
ncbi:endoglucanase-like [Crassostrea angulata]|uniref:endoglucanase-like n=1 Tax=Magallana angulata TaxID=2784310 RepID=UPI0022B17757|nr:endoglucanase-like [Crassostrea angulata]